MPKLMTKLLSNTHGNGNFVENLANKIQRALSCQLL